MAEVIAQETIWTEAVCSMTAVSSLAARMPARSDVMLSVSAAT